MASPFATVLAEAGRLAGSGRGRRLMCCLGSWAATPAAAVRHARSRSPNGRVGVCFETEWYRGVVQRYSGTVVQWYSPGSRPSCDDAITVIYSNPDVAEVPAWRHGKAERSQAPARDPSLIPPLPAPAGCAPLASGGKVGRLGNVYPGGVSAGLAAPAREEKAAWLMAVGVEGFSPSHRSRSPRGESGRPISKSLDRGSGSQQGFETALLLECVRVCLLSWRARHRPPRCARTYTTE